MKHIIRSITALFAIAISATAANAFDTTAYYTNFGQGEFITGRVSKSDLLVCNIDRAAGEFRWACSMATYQNQADGGYKADWPVANRTLSLSKDASGSYTFESRSKVDVTAGVSARANVSTHTLKPLRRYAGNWNTGEKASFRQLSVKRVEFCYVSECWKGPGAGQSLKIIGNFLKFQPGNGNTFFVAALPGDKAIITNFSRNGRRYFADLTLQPFEFRNAAQCVQAYLNALGYPVGKADGALGKKSKTGAANYLAENDVQLPTLSKGTSKVWCDALKGDPRTKGVDVSEFLE